MGAALKGACLKRRSIPSPKVVGGDGGQEEKVFGTNYTQVPYLGGVAIAARGYNRYFRQDSIGV